MSGLDIIPLPGQTTMFARRVAVEAWQAAGSPHVNSAGRLYAAQKYYWDGWRKRLPGYNPADNPDDESQALAHVRFVAFDIDPTPDRIRRLTAAGLIRPYWYEPWHWELPNVRSYSIVRTVPASNGTTPITEESELDMSTTRYLYTKDAGDGKPAYGIFGEQVPGGSRISRSVNTAEVWGAIWGTDEGAPWKEMSKAQWPRLVMEARAVHEAWLTQRKNIAKSVTVNVMGAPGIDYAEIARAVNDAAAARLKA